MGFESIRQAIVDHAENAAARELGYEPLYVAGAGARVAVVGQAPGRRAQESGLPWNDASGRKLIEWLGVTEPQFRDPELFALLPMDFFYPGKGASGDLPPRKGFAERWHPPLLELMPGIRLTVLVGSYAQAYYLGDRAGRTLTDTVRAFRDYLPDVVPLVHPSPLNFRWQARNPWFLTEVVPVLRERVADALA
ncbi:uracil-DNA glycosylase family protein [Myceligenerans pegani]|uniref:Uracil-DNA glycosylase family protein n=1 Tax=Myceligenerans pegani TaxID=2776917 RepID=A0ABR9MVU2_9MICO|nr:uracil-DNA glycosylase family protein [Myceligenerans sp. TRM 65318]MBE1875508.1 uracil-DNA glycosylase family protein [Myceligenerans sp. TRM 65318]MBE3017779.1 uracil-DNA glycosylase family protein [Myceligenerans sp. TRM 65318]